MNSVKTGEERRGEWGMVPYGEWIWWAGEWSSSKVGYGEHHNCEGTNKTGDVTRYIYIYKDIYSHAMQMYSYDSYKQHEVGFIKECITLSVMYIKMTCYWWCSVLKGDQMCITTYWTCVEYQSADQGPSTSPCQWACHSLNPRRAKHRQGHTLYSPKAQSRFCNL